MKKILCSILLCVVAGCSSGDKTTEAVVIRGSNTFGEELAPRLIAEFKKEHPAANFDLEFKGSAFGFGALMSGNSDIAASSREATTNDFELAKDRDIQLSDHIIGAYSVAVVVNAANPVVNLTTDQVRDIFTGAIKNWKDVGGADAAIHLLVRDPISGTYIGFQELAMNKNPYASGLKTAPSHAEIVKRVAADASAIGYASVEAAASAGTKAVSIGGIAPAIETVNKGKYPYARTLRLYTNKAKESSATKDFIAFIQSTGGQKILQEMGYIPASAK